MSPQMRLSDLAPRRSGLPSRSLTAGLNTFNAGRREIRWPFLI
jgi:hypothetical protein